jgi:hypothetical protein
MKRRQYRTHTLVNYGGGIMNPGNGSFEGGDAVAHRIEVHLKESISVEGACHVQPTFHPHALLRPS